MATSPTIFSHNITQIIIHNIKSCQSVKSRTVSPLTVEEWGGLQADALHTHGGGSDVLDLRLQIHLVRLPAARRHGVTVPARLRSNAPSANTGPTHAAYGCKCLARTENA